MPLDYATPAQTMSRQGWLDVGLRLLGVWQIIVAIDDAVAFGNVYLGLSVMPTVAPAGYLTHMAEHALIGLFLLFSAPKVVKALYPPAEHSSLDDPEPPVAGVVERDQLVK